ncbi:hypothetical protein GE278_24245 (plasmid) [Enterobacteriaceae bacterium Kacie_13]|nr:hypothetical protein GE278_24245 [Enterobacteriaceae bacterium Kacie_13]
MSNLNINKQVQSVGNDCHYSLRFYLILVVLLLFLLAVTTVLLWMMWCAENDYPLSPSWSFYVPFGERCVMTGMVIVPVAVTVAGCVGLMVAEAEAGPVMTREWQKFIARKGGSR